MDIGEQKVYKNIHSVEHMQDHVGKWFWRIKYVRGEDIVEDNWPSSQIIKGELL